MKNSGTVHLGAIVALALGASPAIAQGSEPVVYDHDSEHEIWVRGEPTLLYPSAGQMNDHMHERGELMVGLRLERSRYSGMPQRGTRKVGEEALAAAGYMMRGKVMTMDMAMLDIMYAPTDRLTLTLSPQYVWNRMTMVGFDDGGGMEPMPMSSMAMGPMHMGEMKDRADGLGDTLVAASLGLVRGSAFDAHVTLGIWAPTGSVERKNDSGILLDYSMQLGSGTWDLEPSLTASGTDGLMGWGVQTGYRLRAESRNKAGFRFGNRARLSGWLSYLVSPSLGLSARGEFSTQGRVKGEFDGPHYDMMSPSDRPGNYGGEIVTGAVGANWQIAGAGRMGPQLNVEFGIPLYQNLNGIQMPQDWRFSAAIRHTF